MRDLLKYGLIAGGAFYLFRDQIQGALGLDQQPAIAPPTAQPPATQPPAVVPPPVYVPPPPTTPSNPSAVANLPVTDELLKRASWDYDTAAILGSRALLSTHQWNWYREHSGTSRPSTVGQDFTSYGGGDPATPITALQYHAKLQSAGLAGISSNRWRQAWR